MKRIAILLVAAAMVVSIGFAAALALGGNSVGLDPGPTATRPAPSIATPPVDQPILTIDPASYGTAGTPSPLRAPGQRHLWYHDGTWWGVLVASDTGDHRIFRLDPGSRTWMSTGVVVDDRTNAHMDVVWDGASLVVASAGTQPSERHGLRVTRLSYLEDAKTYQRDADFPVALTNHGVETVTVVRGADGRLWLAYVTEGRVELNHSLDTDLAWRGPFVPEHASGDVGEAVMARAGNEVVLVWTRPTEDAIFLASHDVTGPADRWIAGIPAPVAGLSQGQNEMTVAVDPSPGNVRLFIGVRIGLDDAERTPRLDPQVIVIEAILGEEPIVHLFGRVRDEYGAPHLVVDGGGRELLVFAPVPRTGGSIYYKRTSIDDIEFQAGLGVPFLPATAEHPRLRDLTSSKQPVDADSGLVVVATDQTTGVYASAALGLTDTSTGQPESPGPAVAVPILNQTFDGLAVGSPVTGWELDGDPLPSFTVAILTGADGSARLTTEAVGGRACARIGGVDDGRLRVEADGLLNMATDEELYLLQVRGDAGEAASVRLREGQLVYPDGAERIEADRFLAPGRWYRSVFTLDIVSRTYDVVVRDLVTGTALLNEDNLDWRVADSTALERICVEVPAQAGLDLYLNNVVVTPIDDAGG